MVTVFLIEDDKAIAQPLTRALAREGYTVCAYDKGRDALENIAEADLLILDLGLPDMDGLDVARESRAHSETVPILILTARTDEVDMVVGLDAGADDYVTKPFRLAELLARVRALLRRSATNTYDGDLKVQDIRLDLAARRAYQNEQELQLTAKEFELLRILMMDAGNVVPRALIMDEVWGSNSMESTKTLDMHISWLRKKLGDDALHPYYITTVRGMGFRFAVAKKSDAEAK